MNFDNIPPELKKLPQWVIWKIGTRGDGKPTKQPYNPHNNRLASTTDPSTWDTYENAIKSMKDYKAQGIGFVFTEDSPYCGIDLDKCIVDGVIEPWAQEIIDNLDSYTEISYSRTGVHIIVKGKKPTGRCRKERVEIYDKGRYFVFTGDVWQDRTTINKRQDQLNSLCEETFGETPKTTETTKTTEPVSGLVFDPNAEPDEDNLQALLKSNSKFKTAWNRLKKPSPSLSEYDYELACHTIEDGWEDQQIANLIIAFRRKHGKADDLAKALRPDYIPLTIAKAKAAGAGADVLRLLTFKVAKMLQYGKDNSRFSLVVEGVGEIDMGITEDLITTRKANARLLEANLVQSAKTMDRWLDIVRALQPMKEIVLTIDRREETKGWLSEWVASNWSMPKIGKDGSIEEIFMSDSVSMAEDSEGRLYLRLNDAARFSSVHSGMRGVSMKTIAPDLFKIGFRSKELRLKIKDRKTQRTIWISEPGFLAGRDTF
jgi:hypothetical protein